MSSGADRGPIGPSHLVRVTAVGGDDRHAVATRAIAAELGMATADVSLEHDASGRPVVEAPIAGVRVSIAHAPCLSLVAIADGLDVGVDVEPLDRQVSSWTLWGHVLTQRERDALPVASEPRNTALLRAWVRKEALLKAVGVGLAVDPVTIELEADGGIRRVPARLGHPSEWSLRDLSLDGHVASVACRPALRTRFLGRSLAPGPTQAVREQALVQQMS